VFRHTIPLGRIFGIAVDLDYSWFLVLGLFTWMLAVSYFPSEFKNWNTPEYWFMGALTAVLFFVCVLLHELGHSFVAMHYKIQVPRITLFIFGGVSQIAGEPPSAGAEFWIAVAGPIVSLALAAMFLMLQSLLTPIVPLLATAKYLALINGMLAVFNLIPGFPLDGGRVFRAIVWGVSHNFRRATLIAADTGRFIGFLFIAFGVWFALRGNFFNGLWIAFIGWFLESAAAAQVQQQLMQGLLAGHKVSEAMGRDYATIAADTTLERVVHDHILTSGRTSFVIMRDSEVVGLLTLTAIRKVPRAQWPTTTALQAVIPAEQMQWIRPDAELWTALEQMGRNGVAQLPVMTDKTILGMLSRDDLIHYLGLLQALKA
jgi:Zn-dependent protease/CBS domain-containing protein